MSPRRRGRGDRGGALVEFAILAPILFLMMFALADLALAELSDTAGANAAREGARVGILYYDGAHAAGPNQTKITDAVNAKLANNVTGTPTVTVRCLEENGSARPGGGSCATVSGNAVDVGEDLIEVSVTWTRKGDITGFIPNSTRTDRAVMTIVGTPPAGSSGPPSTVCELMSGSATPTAVVHSGGMIPDVTFEVTVNDAGLCGTPLLDLTGVGTLGVETMLSTAPTAYEFTMPSGQGSWTAGPQTFTASANGGSVAIDISFDVLDPAVCLITSASASPSAVTQSGGTLSTAVTFTVAVSDAGVCGTPALTFSANAGYAGPQTMVPASGNTFTFTLPVGQGTWSTQTHNVVANASSAPSTTIPLVVSNAPVCALSNLTITPSTVDVRTNGNHDDIRAEVKISVTRSDLTICDVPTVSVRPGDSGPAGPLDLTAPRSMHNVNSTTAICNALTCEWVIPFGQTNWAPGPSARTVTVTASGSTLTGTLTLT